MISKAPSLLVYVVDDDVAMSRSVIRILASAGISARAYPSGAAALAAARGIDPPALALLDQRLPDTTGTELAAELRAHDADLAVLVLTGYASTETAIAAVGLVDGYLTKPIKPEELIKEVNGALERYRLRRANRDLIQRLQDMNSSLEMTLRTWESHEAERQTSPPEVNAASPEEGREATDELSEFKSQLLTTMSHEIRTPMNAVLGMAHLLVNTELDNDQQHYLRLLRESGEKLLTIIAAMLDFSQGEAGGLKLDLVDFDLPALVRELVDSFTPLAGTKGLIVEVEITADVAKRVTGDLVRLRQVLTNLIDNAIKFTSVGRVTVRVSAGGDEAVLFEVIDTGIGIDPRHGATLFQPFFQVDGSTTRRFEGTGLGLAICQQLVDLMGGHLRFDSVLDRGTCFRFELSLAPVKPLDPPSCDRNGPSVVGEGHDRVDSPPAAPKALLVDDNKLNQLVACAMLKQLSYQVDLSGDGRSALEAVRSTRYDVILMDCLMPVMDGYEATAQIRTFEGASRHTYIIAVTAATTPNDRRKCQMVGMDDFIAKPIDPIALRTALARSAS